MRKSKVTDKQPSLFDPAPEPAAPAPGEKTPKAPEKKVWEVSALASELRKVLEQGFRSIWVQGELSNFRNPAGHWYFTLKDADAQMPCVMFKGKNYLVRPTPNEGDAVLLRGQLSFYGPQGKAQIIVEHLEPAGEGRLLRAFEDLKKKLAREGLFDEDKKREIPVVPRCIGIITSPTGAALQDMLTTLRRRFPLGQVVIYPVPVQGDAAAPAIVQALQVLPTREPVDVVVLARGGGSLEDLWAFNDEAMARAIRACPVPVVTGVGHETDFTIADFAADLRAPTPTGAAERVSPDADEWREHLQELHDELHVLLEDRLHAARESLERLDARFELVHPGRKLQILVQRLDELGERITHALPASLARRRSTFESLAQRLALVHPARRVEVLRLQLDGCRERIEKTMRLRLGEMKNRVEGREALLRTLGPQSVLGRGYAIAQSRDGKVLRDADALSDGDAVDLTLARGKVETRVVKP